MYIRWLKFPPIRPLVAHMYWKSILHLFINPSLALVVVVSALPLYLVCLPGARNFPELFIGKFLQFLALKIALFDGYLGKSNLSRAN